MKPEEYVESGYKIILMPIEELRPHERGSPLYLELLKRELIRDGVLRHPIIADEETRIILDGMHRWLALMSLGYTRIPVLLLNLKNHGLRVGCRRIHRYIEEPGKAISPGEVISAGLSGNLMRPRTTRHFFPFTRPPRIDQPLETLGRGPPRDVSKYIEKMTMEECKGKIKEWLEEISEEMEFLRKRIYEVEKEREEFLIRIKELEIKENGLKNNKAS